VSGRIYDRDDDNNSLQSVIYLQLQAIKKLGEVQFDTTIFNASVQHAKAHTADTCFLGYLNFTLNGSNFCRSGKPRNKQNDIVS